MRLTVGTSRLFIWRFQLDIWEILNRFLIEQVNLRISQIARPMTVAPCSNVHLSCRARKLRLILQEGNTEKTIYQMPMKIYVAEERYLGVNA